MNLLEIFKNILSGSSHISQWPRLIREWNETCFCATEHDFICSQKAMSFLHSNVRVNFSKN